MDKLIREARIGLGIEYLLEPVNDDLVPIRVAKLLVVGEPQIHVIIDAEVDGDERRSECAHRRRQKSDPSSPFDRVENCDTGVCRYADDPFQRLQSENSCVAGLVELHAMLLHDPMVWKIGKRFWQPISIAIGSGCKCINVKPSELGYNEIRIGWSRELDRNIGLQARHVG